MARSKTTRSRVCAQVDKSIVACRKMLTHLAWADCLAKGGRVKDGAMYIPADVAPEEIELKGHPVLNQYMAILVNAGTSYLASLQDVRGKL